MIFREPEHVEVLKFDCTIIYIAIVCYFFCYCIISCYAMHGNEYLPQKIIKCHKRQIFAVEDEVNSVKNTTMNIWLYDGV